MRLSIILSLLLLCFSCARDQRVRQASTTPEPELGKIHLRYHYTASDAERPPASFNVYRAETSAGPFERINRSSIPANREITPGESQLLMTDFGLPLGAGRFYYLEAVDNSGRRRKITSVARAEAVLPMTPEDRREKR